MTLKADFHMHTHYSPDSDMSPERLVRKCVQVGLNCVAVTDHNTVEGALRVRQVAEFTLADRTNLTYEVLIGRNILRDVMLVDVGKEYATELPESIRKSNGNES